ncbi:MAG: hypothetical protein POELPBGB_00386 [Bacteroidia bacterium]|nr:hypothetical protein [Bacteroidia bacterium]
MAKSQATFAKKEKEAKRLKKRQEKEQRKEDRKANAGSGGFESMIAYVDEFGRITDTPPDPSKKQNVDASSIEIGVPRQSEEDEVSPERQGKVVFFDSSKGYGFINETGTGEKYFVHVTGLTEDISADDSVSFELERGMKGMNAVRVKKNK